jgi:hypothetical protein
MVTSINGKEAAWTSEIESLWQERVVRTGGRHFMESEVRRANYFTPRPPVDEWNRGSAEEGFVYTHPNRDGHLNVFVVEWKPESR